MPGATAFSFTNRRIDEQTLRQQLADPQCGGFATFEGWVRNHNEGMSVRHLEYEAFEPLALKEGERIVAEAVAQFGIEHAACVHRVGDLPIGEMAVWVGVSARHRHEAFLACRYIIDEVKHRVPIWKKEHYENGDSGWVNCERCAAAPQSGHPEHAHHEHDDHNHEHDPHEHDPHEHGNRGSSRHLHAPAAGLPHRGGSGDVHPSKWVPDYSRQIALKEVGPAGQAKLRSSRVLVIGCGGLGVPVISYLAGAGIGRLGLLDGDRLEPSNLHRQTMYALQDVGQLKAELATARVRALNPDVDVRTYNVRLDASNAADLISQYDLVIDCSDNFSTKFLLNDFCVQLAKPVVFASVYQYEGQLQVVRADRGGTCLRCVWPEATRDGIVGNCAEAGVLGAVPGVLGSLQAFEALKVLLDLRGQLSDEILVLDLLQLSVSRVRTRRSGSCPQHAIARAQQAQASATAKGRTVDLEVSPEHIQQSAAEVDFVDIREPHELAEVPTPLRGVRHIPMAQLLHGPAVLSPSTKTVLICASGRRSLAATQELRSRGMQNVYSLRGGINAAREIATGQPQLAR
jgi:adenylyltransferase/sulfurtransferase